MGKGACRKCRCSAFTGPEWPKWSDLCRTNIGGGRDCEHMYRDHNDKDDGKMTVDEYTARAAEGFVQQLSKGAAAAAGGTSAGSTPYMVLEDNLKKASRGKFASEFGYAYDGDASTPTAAFPGSAVKGFAGLVNTKIGPTVNISGCIKRSITNDLPIEEWAKEAISTDLTTFVSGLFAAGQAPFAYTKYQQSFTHPTQDTCGQELCVQAAMHYGIVDIPNSEEGGDFSRYLFLYFSGVGYWAAKS